MTRHASIEECRRFYAGEEPPDEDVMVVQGAAARTVAALSSDPADVSPEYAEAAKETELLVGRWIWRSDGGTLSSKALSGVINKSWVDIAAIKSLASASLGEFYEESQAAGWQGALTTMPLERG